MTRGARQIMHLTCTGRAQSMPSPSLVRVYSMESGGAMNPQSGHRLYGSAAVKACSLGRVRCLSPEHEGLPALSRRRPQKRTSRNANEGAAGRSGGRAMNAAQEHRPGTSRAGCWHASSSSCRTASSAPATPSPAGTGGRSRRPLGGSGSAPAAIAIHASGRALQQPTGVRNAPGRGFGEGSG
jgi:hypothetical protein